MVKKTTYTKKVFYTKNGRPYILLANGRARFIPMSQAKPKSKPKGKKK